ncbi:MAG TPA: glycerol-3-phosphate 1-O-acyltransferase PlsY [Stenomitos sp.]
MPPIVLWSLGHVALLLIAYLLGSFPTGYLLGRWLKGIDIRNYGSGSTGATNVLRTLGKGPGAVVLLIDTIKGAVAIALIQWAYSANSPLLNWIPSDINPSQWLPWVAVLAGLAAVLGHSRSVWLNFSGGKSVATSLGMLLMLNWQVGLATFGVFGLMLALSRIVSLSSVTGAIAAPLLMVYLHQPLAYILLGVVGGLYVIVRHRTNLQRLLAGTEPRLGEKPAPIEPTS